MKKTYNWKRFLKSVKPFLSNKVRSSERIKLDEEDDTLITNKEEAAINWTVSSQML